MATVASQLRYVNKKRGPIVALLTKNIVMGGLRGDLYSAGNVVLNKISTNPIRFGIITPLDRILSRTSWIPDLQNFVDKAFSSFEENQVASDFILDATTDAPLARSNISAYFELGEERWHFDLGTQRTHYAAELIAKANLINWTGMMVERYLKEEARIKEDFLEKIHKMPLGTTYTYVGPDEEAKKYFSGEIFAPLATAVPVYLPIDREHGSYAARDALYHLWDSLSGFASEIGNIVDWMIGARPKPDISAIKNPFVVRQKAIDWHEEEWERRQEEERKKKISTYAGGSVENVLPMMKVGEFLFYELTRKEQLQYESACMQHCIGWDSQRYCANMLAGEGKAFAIYREGDPLDGRCSGQTPAATMYFDRKEHKGFAGKIGAFWALNQIHGFKNRKLTAATDARLRKAAAIFILAQGFSPSFGWLDAETAALAPYFQGGRWTGTMPSLDGYRRGSVFYGAPRRRMR